jgi:hypothetical protein
MRSLFGVLIAVGAAGCSASETLGLRFDEVERRVREAEKICGIGEGEASLNLASNRRSGTDMSIHVGCPRTKLSKCLLAYKTQHQLNDRQFPFSYNIGGCDGEE